MATENVEFGARPYIPCTKGIVECSANKAAAIRTEQGASVISRMLLRVPALRSSAVIPETEIPASTAADDPSAIRRIANAIDGSFVTAKHVDFISAFGIPDTCSLVIRTAGN